MYPHLLKSLAASCVLACCAACDPREVGQGPVGGGDAVAHVAERRLTVPPEVSSLASAPSRTVPVYSRDIEPLFEEYCLHCHDSAAARGGVVLDDFRDGVPVQGRRSLLLRVADNLRSEIMPPDGEPHPTAGELETINGWLDAAIGPDRRGAGGVNLRRLNRVEYNNTIRDLIGLDLHPADEFPSDDIGYGFDNLAEVLSTPPILVEMYLSAADKVIAAAWRTPEIRERILNPTGDALPAAFRKFKAPVRTPRVDKVFRVTPVAQDPELNRQQRIYDILRGFADRAFRRPATHDELTRLLGVVLSAEKDGESPESALELGLRTVLAAPQFLYRTAVVDDSNPSGSALPPDDFDLASRLSYFLWSSMPDEELLRLGSHGALRRAESLRPQVERMLKDPKSRALAENFTAQWLQTRKLQEFTPDPTLFPDFDEALRSAMLDETRLFCAAIQDEDRDVQEFLDADFTFVNERLARHYGIPGVTGERFRRVSLAGTVRGGVLTQASVLAATSNPTRTSPVKRGKWILENVLGAPPAPPPSGVEALKEGQGVAAAGTLRQRLERHRTELSCASCHRRMDPLGFGLENFDAIGAWRAHAGGEPIDASGKLPGGKAFRGPAELKAVLRSRRHAFARCLAEKMLTYALGRGLERADRRAVDQIVARLDGEGYRFSALVLAVAESEPFLSRTVSGGNP